MLIYVVPTWKTVVSSSLEVKSHQVHSKAGILGLEQMVGDLLGEEVVKLLPGLSGQTHEDLVQGAWLVDQGGVEEHVGQGDSVDLLAVVVDLLNKVEDALDQSVTKPNIKKQQKLIVMLLRYHSKKRIRSNKGLEGFE